MRLIHLLFVALILFLLSCSEDKGEADTLTDKQTRVIESAVINRFNAMIKYSEAGELENVLMHFDPSGPGSYIDGPTRYTSFKDMADNWRATWRVKEQDYGIPVTKVYILAHNYVLVTSSSTINTSSRDGVVYLPRPWALSTIWALNNGEWQIHSFHQSAAEPVPVPVEEEKPEQK